MKLKLSRIVSALLAAPLMIPLVLFLGEITFSGYPYQAYHMKKLAILTLTAILPINYAFSLLVGALVFSSLLALNKLRLVNFVAISFVLGLFGGVIIGFLTPGAGEYNPLISIFIFGLACALAASSTSFVFCLIAGVN